MGWIIVLMEMTLTTMISCRCISYGELAINFKTRSEELFAGGDTFYYKLGENHFSLLKKQASFLGFRREHVKLLLNKNVITSDYANDGPYGTYHTWWINTFLRAFPLGYIMYIYFEKDYSRWRSLQAIVCWQQYHCRCYRFVKVRPNGKYIFGGSFYKG